MKKQIFVLSTIALATASAQAYTLLDNANSGTKIDFNGSARLLWKSTSTKNHSNGNTQKEHINHAITNNGSRFGLTLNQNITNDTYAFGRVEWRFRGTSSSQHNFDDLYTRQLYAGIGNKKYGDISYGNMSTITDKVKQTDLPNTLSLSGYSLLIGSARKIAQYTYRGIDGLTLGGFIGGKSKHNMSVLPLKNQRKDVWGLAAIYDANVDDIQKIKLGTGVTRERSYNAGANSVYDRTAYGLGFAYTFDQTTFGVDLERAFTNDQGVSGNKRTQEEMRTVLRQQLTKQWAAYTMYAYRTNKFSPVAGNDSKTVKHEYMLGTEYAIRPTPILPSYLKTMKGFAEVATSRVKNYSNGQKIGKSRENAVAVGLRLFW